MISRPPADRLLVAVDVDGTLLDTEFEDRLRPREIAALDAVRAAGHLLALCTGRNSRSTAGLLERSAWQPSDLPLVLLNGAVVQGGVPVRRLSHHVLGATTVRRLLEIFHAQGAAAMVYDTEDMGGVVHHERRAVNEVLGRYLEIRRRTVGYIREVDDLLAEAPDAALEVGTIDRREVIEPLTAAIRAELDGVVSVVNTRSLLGRGEYLWAEVYAAGCHKGAGVRLLARTHGIREDAIVAIGDNYNDLDLFAAARWSVAMAGAPADVRARADRIAGRVQDGGAAEVLEEIAAGRYPPAGATQRESERV
ncbi:MAG: HAD hydrolase family protein [Candidatus Krumholzibacteriia bacterium]